MTETFDQNITVIIPTFNRSTFLLESLDSVLHQTRRPDRVIVINDGSTDDTEQVLQPYLDRIDYIHQENGGKPAALNNALGRIDSGWIWVFDDDDVARPDALENHVRALLTRPDADFTYSAFWFARTNESGRLEKTTFEPIPDLSETILFDALLDDCVMSIQGMLVRQECYNKVGGYNVDLKRAEDYEFFLRLAHEFDGVGIEEPTYLRRVHEGVRGSGSNSHDAKSIQEFFLNYESQVFEKLYLDLPLSSYSARLTEDGAPARDNTPDMRRARVKRASCMFRKGLWENGLADLRVLNESKDVVPLTSQERRMCFKAFSPELIPYKLSDQHGVLDALRTELNSDLLRAMKAEMARGIMSRLLRDVRSSGLKPFLVWARIVNHLGLGPFLSARALKPASDEQQAAASSS